MCLHGRRLNNRPPPQVRAEVLADHEATVPTGLASHAARASSCRAGEATVTHRPAELKNDYLCL